MNFKVFWGMSQQNVRIGVFSTHLSHRKKKIKFYNYPWGEYMCMGSEIQQRGPNTPEQRQQIQEHTQWKSWEEEFCFPYINFPLNQHSSVLREKPSAPDFSHRREKNVVSSSFPISLGYKNTFRNNQWVKEGITRKIFKIYWCKQKWNHNIPNLMVWTKVVLKRKFIRITAYIKKERKISNNLTLFLKKLEKEEKHPCPKLAAERR